MSNYFERFRICKDLLEELLAIDAGLSRWEVQFIEDISHRLEDDLAVLTDKQLDKIEEIYYRHC